jgi:alginate O-acetyltransferase complex protein AlgI
MIFTSFEFVFFFVAVLLLRNGFRTLNSRNWFLLAASYAFFISGGIPGFLLLFLISLCNYWVGLGFGRVEDGRNRKLLLWVSIATNLGVLFFFKYTNFLLDSVWSLLNSLGWHVNRLQYDINLPIGISFFIFIGLTYTIEIYRRNMEPSHSSRDVLLFIGFFPQILAGPINRAVDLLPQFKGRVRAKALDFETGLAQFGLGAVKKLVISDRITPHVDLIFAAPGNYDGFTLLQGLLGYTIQIYCDFSGYSDMAIGCARMMGFRFMENFQMPYSAVTITEFWRRWHISLSYWFRDYLYIPLGGNRKGRTRTYINLMVTMLLCGLWHGANWNFVVWGGLHGSALAIHRIWKGMTPFSWMKKLSASKFVSTILSRLLTLGVVIFGWLFFRAQSWGDAIQYIGRLFTWSGDGTRMVSPYILSAIVVMVLTHLIIHKDQNWAQEIIEQSLLVRIAHYSILVLLIACLGATESSPFIYFQF